MFIKVLSAANLGLRAVGVDVEVNVANRGLPNFEIVGLPNKAVDESRERVRTAIINSKIHFPSRRIIINLAPADIPKEGSFYDLPIAIGIVVSTAGIKIPENSLFFGELSLDGTLRHTKGGLLLALFAKEKGVKRVFVPKASANEASIIKGVDVYPVGNLNQLLAHFSGREKIKPQNHYLPEEKGEERKTDFDMAEVLGQEQAKRALEIAAAGGHNLFMVGSPGSGKTMLARTIPDILPSLMEEEALEVTKIYSASGNIPPEGSIIQKRPFRAPHYGISQVGLIGGGSRPQPGEITLAHRGVLFLDEFNEFPRSATESLRQPMEDGRITISRSRERITYPSRFILIASSNPCPCGYLWHPKKVCTCTQREIEKYRKRISGPILDRIDLHVKTPVVDIKKLSKEKETSDQREGSAEIKKRIVKARDWQKKRFENENIYTNGEMKNSHIKRYCPFSEEVKKLLVRAGLSLNLSARSYFKMIKVARTIADLDNSEKIKVSHMAEALQYRAKEYNRES